MIAITLVSSDDYDMGRSRGGGGGQGVRTPPPPLQNHKNLGFLSNTGPDPLKNHKATKPEFNVGPSSACQQNTIKWCFAGVPMMARIRWY